MVDELAHARIASFALQNNIGNTFDGRRSRSWANCQADGLHDLDIVAVVADKSNFLQTYTELFTPCFKYAKFGFAANINVFDTQQSGTVLNHMLGKARRNDA